MNRVLSSRRISRTAITFTAGILLFAAMLAAMGAGPDEPRASALGDSWQTFEGHAFADSRIVPEGLSLIACLGGCENGYTSEPATIGADGLYSDLTVAPGRVDRSALPDGDIITFWLVGHDENIRAVQWSLFTGDRRTVKLHLSFSQLPVPVREATEIRHDTVTTDLTVPEADTLGLTPVHSPRGYVNSWSYSGIPVLPGLTIVAGLLLAAIGVSVLMHRRRLTW